MATTDTAAGQAVHAFVAKVQLGDLDAAVETYSEDAPTTSPGRSHQRHVPRAAGGEGVLHHAVDDDITL